MATAVAEFQRLLAALAGNLSRDTERLLSGMDRLDRVEALKFITDAYPVLATPYASAAANLTVRWYEEQPGPSDFLAVPADPPNVDRLAASGRWALLQRTPITALQGSATRSVFDSSRNTVVANTQREGVRWARHASPTACGFCRMLASRGAVYRTEDNALKAHDNCHCLAVPDRDGSFEPASYVAQWARDEQAAREGGARTLAEIANAMDKGRAQRQSAGPATASGGSGPPTPPPPARGAASGADEPEGWSGHVKGYTHPRGLPVWTERERVRRQNALGDIVPAGEQLHQHEIESVERLIAAGQTIEWIPRDTRTFLPTNDFRWINRGGVPTELKSARARYPTIQNTIVKAVTKTNGKPVVKDIFVIDIGDAVLTPKLEGQLRKYNMRNPNNRIRELWVITRGVLRQLDLL